MATKQFFRQGIFKKTLDCAAHRAGAVLRIVSFLDEKFLRALLQLDVNVLRLDARKDFVHFEINNAQ